MMTYRIDLDRFEGPLDLLLHLIRKNDLDIHDIPIAFILEQYLEYLKQAEDLNIDLAGEFILMASELAYIKSKMLLPPDPTEEEDEGPDPREELAQRLLLYEQYKNGAAWLGSRPLLGRDIFAPPHSSPEGVDESDEIEIDMTALLAAYHRACRRLDLRNPHQVRIERLSVATRMLDLVERLKGKKSIDWMAFFEDHRTKEDLVVTFLALLEMARVKMIRLTQAGPYGGITVHSQMLEA